MGVYLTNFTAAAIDEFVAKSTDPDAVITPGSETELEQEPTAAAVEPKVEATPEPEPISTGVAPPVVMPEDATPPPSPAAAKRGKTT